ASAGTSSPVRPDEGGPQAPVTAPRGNPPPQTESTSPMPLETVCGACLSASRLRGTGFNFHLLFTYCAYSRPACQGIEAPPAPPGQGRWYNRARLLHHPALVRGQAVTDTVTSDWKLAKGWLLKTLD